MSAEQRRRRANGGLVSLKIFSAFSKSKKIFIFKISEPEIPAGQGLPGLLVPAVEICVF